MGEFDDFRERIGVGVRPDTDALWGNAAFGYDSSSFDKG